MITATQVYKFLDHIATMLLIALLIVAALCMLYFFIVTGDQTMGEKPATQSVSVGGIDAHGGMGEGQSEGPTPMPIPSFLMAEGKRQADAGAHFYGKLLRDLSREELYACIVAAWFEAGQHRNERDALEKALNDAQQLEAAREQGA